MDLVGREHHSTPTKLLGRKRHIVRSSTTHGVEILRMYDSPDTRRRKELCAFPEYAVVLEQVEELRERCEAASKVFDEASKRKRQRGLEPQDEAAQEQFYRSEELMLDSVAQACIKFLADKVALDNAKNATRNNSGSKLISGALVTGSSLSIPASGSAQCSDWSAPPLIPPEGLDWSCCPPLEPIITPGISARSSMSRESMAHISGKPDLWHSAEQSAVWQPCWQQPVGHGYLDSNFLAEMDGILGLENPMTMPCQLAHPGRLYMQQAHQASSKAPRKQLPEQLPTNDFSRLEAGGPS